MADLLDRTIQWRPLFWLAVGIIAPAIVAYILWAHVLAPGRAVPVVVGVHLDPRVCHPETWAAVAEAYRAAGALLVTFGSGGLPVLGVGPGVIAYIVTAHIHPERDASGSTIVAVDPTGGPCTPDRWELACDRWRSQGWPCLVGEGPGALSVETITLPDVRGAHRAGAIGLAANACGESDPAPEHELGHAFSLPDCPGCPIGDVMGSPHTRAGLRIPRRVTAEGE